MVYLDDSIMQKGCLATAGSRILENFTAPFDATVVSRLASASGPLASGAEKIERVKLSEFGLGEIGELKGSPMLCNDVFGFVRRRAVKQGLCYIRPTYGTVSRFGLIPVASSMDQIGIVCKSPMEGFSLLSAIAGYDENDGAMFPEKSYSYKATGKEIKWAVLGPCNADSAPELFVKGKGIKAIVCKDDYAGAYDHVMQILSFAEISNNISRYDGIKFGFRASNYRNLDGLYTMTRTEGFGLEAKLAALMGVVVLTKDYYEMFYDKAMRIRRLVKESLKFDEYDVIVLPDSSPLAVLAGLPSLTFAYKGMGVQLAAGVRNENMLLKAWEAAQS